MELEREICSKTENGWHVMCKTGEHIRRKGTGKLVQRSCRPTCSTKMTKIPTRIHKYYWRDEEENKLTSEMRLELRFYQVYPKSLLGIREMSNNLEWYKIATQSVPWRVLLWQLWSKVLRRLWSTMTMFTSRRGIRSITAIWDILLTEDLPTMANAHRDGQQEMGQKNCNPRVPFSKARINFCRLWCRAGDEAGEAPTSVYL